MQSIPREIPLQFHRTVIVTLLLATASFADTALSLKLDSPNSQLGPYGVGWLNFTNDANGDPLLMMCVDDRTDISYGLDYIYDFSFLGTDLNGAMGSVKFGSVDYTPYGYTATQAYEAAAYLAWQYYLADPKATNQAASQDFNLALWTLFDPGGFASTIIPAGDTNPDTYRAHAICVVQGGGGCTSTTPLSDIYAATRIYTPNLSLNGGADSQEFFGEPAPEPATAGLCLCAALVLLIARRGRRRTAGRLTVRY